MPKALIITTSGINCDREMAEAFELAGAESTSVHLNRLITDPGIVDGFHLIGLPGGFSYGDAVAAGRIAAQVMRSSLYEALLHALDREVPMIAPCNGFQIAVQIGLLPGVGMDISMEEGPPVPTVALADNESARFIDRWVRIEVPEETRCIWTKDLMLQPETSMLPIAHGEGRFVASSETCDQLDSTGCVAVRYVPEDNPNGSMRHIAGICDPTGLIFGLMPHPERYTRWSAHPTWTRLAETAMSFDPPGLQIFRNAVDHVAERTGTTAACDAQ